MPAAKRDRASALDAQNPPIRLLAKLGSIIAQSDAQPAGWQSATLEDGIRNLCYTAFNHRATGKNPDDAGECDWMNDTLPIIERGIKNLLASIDTAPPRPDASGLIKAAEWHEEKAADYERQVSKAKGDGNDSGLILSALSLLRDEHTEAANYLRTRAADRSAPAAPRTYEDFGPNNIDNPREYRGPRTGA